MFHLTFLFPGETRMNDTLVIKNILGNLTLKVKFKETNE